MFVVTQEDKNISFSPYLDAKLKIQILNDDDTVLEELIGYKDLGTVTIDATSSVRRTYSFTLVPTSQSINVTENSVIWINHKAVLFIGLKTPRMTDYKWYECGRFIFTDTSSVYNATTNTLTVNCGDLFTSLDGTQNGSMGSLTTTIPAYEEDENGNPTKYNIIRDVLISVLTQIGKVKRYLIDDIGEFNGCKGVNKNYLEYRKNNPLWNTLPYDLEYSCGDTVSSIIDEIMNLYPNWDYSFDRFGVFIARMKPSCYDEQVVMTNDDIKKVFVSESTITTLTTVRNVTEVWGKTFDTDFYSEDCSTSGKTWNVTVDSYEDEYVSNDVISFKTSSANIAGMCININGIGSLPIYNDATDEPIEAGVCLADTIYTFKYKKKYIKNDDGTNYYDKKFYLLGQWQPHGINVLTDGSVIKNGYTTASGTVLDKYSLEYFKDVYGCDTVSLTVVKDSPFTVQKIGERLNPLSGGDYDNISSDSAALQMAEYRNWEKCRLTDNVTVTVNTLLPWLDENVKVSYVKANETEEKEYVTQNISLDLTNGTTSIQMYTFYPLYQE